jgi:hypothetical protein
MIYLQRMLDWAKQNPLTVAAIAVTLVCATVWPLMVLRPGANFRQKVQADANAQLRQIDQYLSRTVNLPPRTADGSGESVSMVINQSAIDRRAWISRRINDEYRSIYEQAIAFNAAGRQPLLEGLFPRPVSDSLPVLARDAYLEAFREMLREYNPDARLPRLNAGMPPTMREIEDEIAKVEQEFAAEFGQAALSSPSPELAEELLRRKQQRVKDLLVRRARGIHIYAETGATGPLPFDMDAWASQASIPSMDDLWESQLSLWIQQDIVEAIARTNRVDNPTYDVMTAPVKRLMRLDVVRGYVGIDTSGGMSERPAASVARAGTRGRPSPVGGMPVPGGMSREEQIRMGLLPPDEAAMDTLSFGEAQRSRTPAEAEASDAIEAMDLPPRDYTVGHTGRTSTRFHDVRHAWLTVVVDSAQLPLLLDNLSKVNFMTVLRVSIVDVDEYEALLEGYAYGSGDAVEASILIETVWLRHWTNALMPRSVRQRIGAVDLVPVHSETGG